jgi:hypothetical protein
MLPGGMDLATARQATADLAARVSPHAAQAVEALTAGAEAVLLEAAVDGEVWL